LPDDPVVYGFGGQVRHGEAVSAQRGHALAEPPGFFGRACRHEAAALPVGKRASAQTLADEPAALHHELKQLPGAPRAMPPPVGVVVGGKDREHESGVAPTAPRAQALRFQDGDAALRRHLA
jgi:hypothetical protein